MIGKTISHYKILKKLGEGGMGVVYKAEDTKLDRHVALKFLPSHLTDNEEEKQRFVHEAKSASALNHPNIMTIFEIDEVEGQTFIAMECIEGETLKDKVEKAPLKTKELLNIAIAVADGLNAAHEHDIVHRDIKSENIMISKTSPVKIMDFGLAKRKGMTKITKTGSTLGTLAYMSPEQAEGLEVDRRSDLFSFGVVMYEMATGQLPFKGEHDAAIMYSIVNEAPILVSSINPNIPQVLERIIHKALNKEVEDRYQHADDLQTDLKNLKKEIETRKTVVTKTDIPITKEPEKKPIWSKRAFIFVSVFVIIVIIISIFIFKRVGQTPITKIEENSLAVLYFENLKDPEDSERLGQILQELIIADLSEVEFLKVFSSQRLFDIQKQLGSRDRKKIDPEFATEIAQQAGAQTMLIGSISQLGGMWILTSQLIDAIRGTVIKSQRIDGNDLYIMVDALAEQVRGDLDLPITREDVVKLAVSDKTTSSLEAYQFYLEGVDLLNEQQFDSAIVQLKKAITVDSTFNQAYYKLATAQWWNSSILADEAIDYEALESLSKILSSSDPISKKERYLTEGTIALIKEDLLKGKSVFQNIVKDYPDEKEGWYGLGEAYFHLGGEDIKALDAFERTLDLDPEFKLAYRHIYDIYYNSEMFDRGIERFLHYTSLYPNEPLGYRYVGTMHRAKGEFNTAIDYYQKALEVDPKDFLAKQFIARTFALMGDYRQAATKYNELLNPEVPLLRQYYSKRYLSLLYSEQGQYSKAIKIMEETRDIGKSINLERETNAVWWLGLLNFCLGDLETALALFDNALDMDQRTGYLLSALFNKGVIYARKEDQDSLEHVIRQVQEMIDQEGIESQNKYAFNALLIEYFHLQGDIKRALLEFNNLKDSKAWNDWMLHKQAMLYLENNDFDRAINISHDMQAPYIFGHIRFVNYPLGYYVRGRVHEKMGELDLARENYEKLLTLWQNGDESIPERQDALKRLSKIMRLQG